MYSYISSSDLIYFDVVNWEDFVADNDNIRDITANSRDLLYGLTERL